jgi:hypothetical protein
LAGGSAGAWVDVVASGLADDPAGCFDGAAGELVGGAV